MCRARTPTWRCSSAPSALTHCPYKGDASYYSVKADGKTLDNAIWTYETPFPRDDRRFPAISAFYPDKVKIEEVE